MKKIIGIIGRERQIKNRSFLVFYKSLINQIYNHGFLPLGVLLDYKTDDYKYFIDLCDGIILEGGEDEYEIDNEIVKYIYNKNIPTLGICLGMQMMGKALNGNISLVNSSNHNSENTYVHSIKINKKSKLYKIIGNDKIMVNSHHNDHLTNTDLFISALSNDGIIEAIEDPNRNYFIGVQWHPETTIDENSKKLFESFFKEVKRY